jgi:hypothetical protein
VIAASGGISRGIRYHSINCINNRINVHQCRHLSRRLAVTVTTAAVAVLVLVEVSRVGRVCLVEHTSGQVRAGRQTLKSED